MNEDPDDTNHLDQKSVGRAISFFRSASKISRETLAEKTGLDGTRLLEIERGAVAINTNEIYKIAAVFGVTPDDFLTVTERISKIGRPPE